MSIARIAFLYALFAVIAAAVNLAFQRLSLSLYDQAYGLAIAIGVGTMAGLVVKYVLDKRWIFADFSTGMSAHTKRFGLYTLMGVVTTAIFWGTEVAFYEYWGTDRMREVGAIIGLTIGYVVKYQLDRRYVFNQAA
ncbi:GtrA family protein [Rhodobacteraceae bacterium NNCM2]|nr:GtrA family protein [Coraliihabitans acroporae]